MHLFCCGNTGRLHSRTMLSGDAVPIHHVVEESYHGGPQRRPQRPQRPTAAEESDHSSGREQTQRPTVAEESKHSGPQRRTAAEESNHSRPQRPTQWQKRATTEAEESKHSGPQRRPTAAQGALSPSHIFSVAGYGHIRHRIRILIQPYPCRIYAFARCFSG